MRGRSVIAAFTSRVVGSVSRFAPKGTTAQRSAGSPYAFRAEDAAHSDA